MSETTPDPADVHTGTDRVELTEDERATLEDAINESLDTYANASFLIPAVESIVAARVQALAAERDEQRAIITQLRGTLHVCPKQQKAEAERDAARAELAAANARCAELEAERDNLQATYNNVWAWWMEAVKRAEAAEKQIERLGSLNLLREMQKAEIQGADEPSVRGDSDGQV